MLRYTEDKKIHLLQRVQWFSIVKIFDLIVKLIQYFKIILFINFAYFNMILFDCVLAISG